MRTLFGTLILFVALAALHHGARTIAATSPAEADLSRAQCIQYFHQDCRSWIGHWINGLPIYMAPRSKAVAPAQGIEAIDGFVYHGQGQLLSFVGGPEDGTWFTYGTAGPPKGRAIYDYAHRIVFFGQGCCSWGSTVVESQVGPPPHVIARTSLSSMRTLRGAQLGMSVANIRLFYGAAPLGQRGIFQQLHYIFRKTGNGLGPCTQDQQFLFSHGKLIAIAIGDAC